MGNLRDERKLRNMQPTDVVLGADEDGCLVNFPPDNFSGSIPITIDTETGVGEELFTEPEVNSFLFKKIKSEDESIEITTDTDGNINASVNFPTFPTIDYPVTESEDVGDGISLRRNLVSKKIGVRTLKSDSFIITEEGDGSVKINAAGGGSNSSDYYLDVNFTRPSNWTEKAESIDGIKTAQGTLNDPFKTFEEYLRRCIGETGGSNVNGLYSRVNPKNPNKTLQILSDLTTDKELEINTSRIIFNKINLVYNGSQTYGADTERLWTAMPKTSGILNREIYFEIGGEGTMTNLYHFGCINHKTSSAGTTSTVRSYFVYSPTGEGITFFESPESATYTGLTNADGSPFLHSGVQVMGSTQSPTTPILKFDGRNNIFWGASIIGSKITIRTNTQTAIECVNEGSLICSADTFRYLVNANYIGYEKKLYTGLSGITSDETELLVGRSGLFFRPYSSRKIFSVKGAGNMTIERISTINDSRVQLGVDAIFHTEGGSVINSVEKFSELSGGSAISFVSSIGAGNSISFKNVSQISYINYFVRGDNTNSVNIKFENSQVNNIDKISKTVSALNVNTAGTWSSIKSIPINTGIVNIVNNTAAIAPPYNYINGMAYFNTTENAMSIVS